MVHEQETPRTASAPAAKPVPRGPVVRFISLYVILLVVLLTGLRYTAGTAAMDRYLFQIAWQTHTVLRMLGHEAHLEHPGQYKGREAAIRALIKANTAVDGGEAVLTPKECWQYRRLVLRESRAAEAEKASPDPERMARFNTLLKGSGPVVFCGAPHAPETFQFQVVPECSGISAMLIFGVAVLVFPAPWRKRLAGILLGFPILHLINVLRLAILALIGAATQGGAWFVFMHNYAWEVINIILILLLWLAWVELVVPARTADTHEAS